MRRLARAVGIALTVGLMSAPAAAAIAPVNDDFANATSIPAPVSTNPAAPTVRTGNTVDASLEESEPRFTDGVSQTVWFSHSPSVGGLLKISTCSDLTDYDTTLAVYTGTAPPFAGLDEAASNDDACELRSEVALYVAPGTVYYIQVGGFTSGGNFQMELSLTPDTTAPTCEVSETTDTVPKQQKVLVVDEESGIDSITDLQIENGTFGFPAFPPGAKGITTTATKNDQSELTRYHFTATDQAGNSTFCT